MEMQQDGSLVTAVQEALGTELDTKTALQQRIKQLLASNPVMLFMKVSLPVHEGTKPVLVACSCAMWQTQSVQRAQSNAHCSTQLA